MTLWAHRFALLAFMICTAVFPVQSSSATETTAKIRYSAFRVADPVYVAQKKGFFAARGVSVEFVDNPGGTTGIQAVATGRVEAAGAPVPSLILAVAARLPVIGISDFQSALPKSPVEEFFVTSKSTARSISDLQGRTVAVNALGGSFQYTIVQALQKAGLRSDAVQYVVLSFDKQLPALLAGQVDLIGLVPPYSTKATKAFSADVRRLFDALDVFGPKQFVLHCLNANWAKQNPSAARAFVGAVGDAADWINSHPEETKILMSEYTGVELEFMPEFRFQSAARVILDDINFWIDVMKRDHPSLETITSSAVATNDYNPKLKP